MQIRQNTLLARGFTLVELLVSMTITIIIIGLLVFVTRAAFDTLSEGTGDISSYQKGEQVLEQLATDLETMVYRSGNDYAWLIANSNHATAQAGTTNALSGFSTDLSFFSVVQDRYNGAVTANNGDVACIRYGMQFIDPIGGGDQRMVMYRQVIDPNVTFNSFLGLDETGLTNALDNNNALFNAVNVLSDNIRELSVSFTLESSTTPAGGGAPVSVIHRVDAINDGSADAGNLVLLGNGIEHGGALDPNARIVSIDINAQILSEEALGYLNLRNVPLEKVAQGIKRFSKTIYVAQVH